MQDRPDLIQSELSGVAFDSMQQAFRACDVDYMFKSHLQQPERNESSAPRLENIATFFAMEAPRDQIAPDIFVFVDPAAGGPQSDYAIITVLRSHGVMQVCYVSRA